MLPDSTQRLIGSPGHAIVWGLSMAPDGDFFVALDNSKKVPLTRYPFERVRTSILELDPRSGHQVPDGAGDQNTSRAGLSRHAGADMHRDSTHILAHELDLSSMQPAADFDAELTHDLLNGGRTANAPCWAIEDHQEAIPSCAHLAAAKTREFSADEDMMPLKQPSPGTVPKSGSPSLPIVGETRATS